MHPFCCQFLATEHFPSLFHITFCPCPFVGSCWEGGGRAPCQPAGWCKSLLHCVAMAKKWREFPSAAVTGCWHFLCACHWQEVLFWVNTAIDSRRQTGGYLCSLKRGAARFVTLPSRSFLIFATVQFCDGPRHSAALSRPSLFYSHQGGMRKQEAVSSKKHLNGFRANVFSLCISVENES